MVIAGRDVPPARSAPPRCRPSPLPRAALAWLAALAMLTACGSDGAVTATPRAPTPSPEAATPAAGPTATATATATPMVVDATPAPTATRPLEPIASTAVLARAALPVVEFVRADGAVVSLPVEVLPRDEFSVGLSGRYQLDERGMLFYYPQPRRTGFWMKNTHIDLAIAFIAADGRVNEIRELVAESEDIVQPAEDFQIAIEAPSGWYAAHGVAPGDTLRLTFELADWIDLD